MDKAILISHSSRDDNFVGRLYEVMEAHGLFNWVDSRVLRGGSDLTQKIHTQIEKARAFIVVISPDAFNSAWVAEETRYASQIKEKRQDDYPIIALLREGIELGALKWIFSKEPVAIRVKDDKKGISAAMPHIMAALGENFPGDSGSEKTIYSEPVEELFLELKSPRIREKHGKRRAAAEAELTYIPAARGQPRIKCHQPFLFTSPLGPIEIEELSWYLERYYLWSADIFRIRAENVEKKLPEWGHALYQQVMPEDSCDNIISAWQEIGSHTERRFVIFVDFPQPKKNQNEEQRNEAEDASNLLLGLPWELIHDGNSYLFQGAKYVRVRRRLQNT